MKPAVLPALLLVLASVETSNADMIYVPGASFESPVTAYADPRIDFWQKTSKPAWYDESQGFPWNQLSGVFVNTAAGASDHIDNCDLSQALFLFCIPEAGFFQDYDSTDWQADPAFNPGWTNVTPSHAFNVRYEAGKSYRLTAGFIGGGGGMVEGSSVQLSLYYRANDGSFVTVGATNIVYSTAVFSNTTRLVTCQLDLPVAKSDACVGKNIGIEIVSTSDFNHMGGYWDIDNVQLIETRETTLQGTVSGGLMALSIQSEPGLRFEILTASQIATPASQWTSLGFVTNVTGVVSVTDANKDPKGRFYRARLLP